MKNTVLSFALSVFATIAATSSAQAASRFQIVKPTQANPGIGCLTDQHGRLIGIDPTQINSSYAKVKIYASNCEDTPEAQFWPPALGHLPRTNGSYRVSLTHPDFCTPAVVKPEQVLEYLPACKEVSEVLQDALLGRPHTYTYEAKPHLETQPVATRPPVEFRIVAPSTLYSDTNFTLGLETPVPVQLAAYADYQVVVYHKQRKLGTWKLPPGERGITLNLSKYLDHFSNEISFELLESVKRQDWYGTYPAKVIATRSGYKYRHHDENYSEGSAQIINPLHPRSYPGAVLITGVVVYDFFTEDLYRCAGAEKSFAQYDIGNNNRLLSCGAAALDVFGVGDLLKLGAKGDDVHDIYKVTRKFRENGNTYVELKPATRTDIANSAYKSKRPIPTPDQVFVPAKTVKVNRSNFLVNKNFHTDSKWLAHFTKHGDKLGTRTHQAYLDRAFEFSTQAADNQTIFRKQDRSGKVFTFNRRTSELSVVGRNGSILSYYVVDSTQANRQLVNNYNTKLNQGRNPRTPVPYQNAWDYYLRQGNGTSGVASN